MKQTQIAKSENSICYTDLTRKGMRGLFENVEMTMKILATPIEQPYAVATKASAGIPYPSIGRQYFATEKEAEGYRKLLVRKKHYAGEVEYRPGECRRLGYV